jgi:hypothetical protein
MKLLRIIGRYKVYLDRARAYLTIFTFLAAWAIMINRLDWPIIKWLNNHKLIYYPSFIILFLAGCLIIGYLDKKYIRPHEQKEVTSTNPVINEMKEDIKKIINKL